MRRVVTPVAEAGRVVALAVRGREAAVPWEGAVAVRVDLAVFDPEPYGIADTDAALEAAIIGTVLDTPSGADLRVGERVAGIAALADTIMAPPGTLIPLAAADPSPDDAVALLDASLRAAMGMAGIFPGARVAISGQGLAARLAEYQARALTGVAPKLAIVESGRKGRGRASSEDGTFDVLVDTAADATRWSNVLGQLQRHGRVLLLIPPGPQVRVFDFYPRIHKGSYTLRVCRWPSLPAGALDRSTMSLDGISTARVHIKDPGLVPLPSAAAVVCQFSHPS